MADPVDMARAGGGMALLVAGGGVLKWAADLWLKARRSPEQKASDAAKLDAQSIKNASALMGGMRDDLDALRDEIKSMRQSHRLDMEAAAAREAAAALREAACEQRVDRLAAQIRALTNGATPIIEKDIP